MKMASIYIDKLDIAKQLGINPSQFVFGKVEGSIHEIQFDVIIDSNAEVKGASEIGDNHWNATRQKLDLLSEEYNEE